MPHQRLVARPISFYNHTHAVHFASLKLTLPRDVTHLYGTMMWRLPFGAVFESKCSSTVHHTMLKFTLKYLFRVVMQLSATVRHPGSVRSNVISKVFGIPFWWYLPIVFVNFEVYFCFQFNESLLFCFFTKALRFQFAFAFLLACLQLGILL